MRTCVAPAQNAELTGLVQDSQQADVPNARVAVTSTQTNIKRTASSNGRGLYTVTQLPPGIYEVTATAAGFQTEVQRGVSLQVEQQSRLDFTLQVGSTQQSITVESTASVMQTESASVGTVIN